MSQRLQVRLLSIFVLFLAWEYFGRRVNPILFTYPTAIGRAFIGLVASGELQSYMKESLLVLLYASILAAGRRCFPWRGDGALFYRRLGYGYLRQRALFHADGCDGPSDRSVVWLQGSG